MRANGSLDRAMRRALEDGAKQLRLQGQLEGWPRDRVVDEILRQLPEITPLEAHRFAAGWTRQELSRALDALYEADGLMPPGISVSEICRWEHGQCLPNAERQEYLTRLYRTRPDRLGFGRDYSSHEPETADPGPRHGVVAASAPSPERLVGISAGVGDRIVSIRWADGNRGGVELVVEVEDGDGDGRAVLRLAGWPARDGHGQHHPAPSRRPQLRPRHCRDGRARLPVEPSWDHSSTAGRQDRTTPDA
ncbi:MAG TPA: helix-turn-helix transcriptional regulator [Candidatus Dormibacteraeota bacterium]|nr:helix-turn-helix transcriptional regulator [Candidatus Dormibacteraeota bacterium]